MSDKTTDLTRPQKAAYDHLSECSCTGGAVWEQVGESNDVAQSVYLVYVDGRVDVRDLVRVILEALSDE